MMFLFHKNVYDVFRLKKQKAIYIIQFSFRCAVTRGREEAFPVAFYLNSETGFMCILVCVRYLFYRGK